MEKKKNENNGAEMRLNICPSKEAVLKWMEGHLGGSIG